MRNQDHAMTNGPIFSCLDILAPVFYTENKTSSSIFSTAVAVHPKEKIKLRCLCS